MGTFFPRNNRTFQPTTIATSADTPTFVQNKTITVAASGLRPDSMHIISAGSIVLGNALTGADGKFSTTITIPNNTFTLGTHEVLVYTPDRLSEGTTSFTVSSNVLVAPKTTTTLDTMSLKPLQIVTPTVYAIPGTSSITIPNTANATQETAARATTLKVSVDSTHMCYLKSIGSYANSNFVIRGPASQVYTITGEAGGTANVTLPDTNNLFSVEFRAQVNGQPESIVATTTAGILVAKEPAPPKPTTTPTPVVYLQSFDSTGAPASSASGIGSVSMTVQASTNTTASGAWSWSSSNANTTITGGTSNTVTISYSNTVAATQNTTITATFTANSVPYTKTVGLSLSTTVVTPVVTPVVEPIAGNGGRIRTEYYSFLEY